ncbi:MAG: ATP-dependent sacrificial sulfur transferase LarE [Actinomycetota bacterium]
MDELAVGFDVDMTLVDSRESIIHSLQQALSEWGLVADDHRIAQRIGVPMALTLPKIMPELTAAEVADIVRRYREIYLHRGVPMVTLLPGAAAAVEAVKAHRGQVVVVTGKAERAASLVMEHVGLSVDALVGDRFAHAKGDVLRDYGVGIYVGDHPGDIAGAHAAGAVAVAVATGAHSAPELVAAGADVVLGSLTELPSWLDTHVLRSRLAALEGQLRKLGRVVVAFSGGADSAFLLAAAVRALGPQQVVAVTAISDSLAAGERAAAAEFARDLGVRHLTATTDELTRPGYQANGGDRCYYCKSALLDALTPVAAEMGEGVVVTGTNADDAVAGFRPGIRAADERGAQAPLRDAGFTKAQVREASRQWGLPTWDKPQAACLSSRVAYGVPISSAGLARVDHAERSVRSWFAEQGMSLRDLRVRDLGDDRARIELDTKSLADLIDSSGIEAVVREAGFHTAHVDPAGFRSGSLNDSLSGAS